MSIKCTQQRIDMIRYWSCTKFANKIRGTPKPSSATMEDWDNWKETAKANHPIRYWIAEEGLDKIQTFIRLPITCWNNIRYYINNRFITKTHTLTSKSLKKGKWHEFEDRILHCMFDELVNFVEIETAWSNIVWDKEKYAQFKAPWYSSGLFRFRIWRSAEAGLDHLDWASKLVDDIDNTPTRQAIVAQETKELYLWWTQERPNRVDPWSEFDYEDLSSEQQRELFKMIDDLEQAYAREDETNLIRLIKIRQSLWT